MSKRAQRWRVPLGFIAAAALIILAHPTPAHLALGLSIAVLGLCLRAAAAGHIHKNDVLATTGPYRFTRNPLYLGSTLLGAGMVIAAGSWILALIATALFAGVYVPVIRAEEQYLARRFGAAFHAYAAQVPRLLPRWPARNSEPQAPAVFSFTLYRRHREYQALLGFVGLAAILVWKCHNPFGPGWWLW